MKILAEHLNKISVEVRANAITAVQGGTFQRTNSGTSIQIPQTFSGGGTTVAPDTCVFRITNASTEEATQVEVAFGTINGRVPDGMILGTPYILAVSDSGYIYAGVTYDPNTLEMDESASSVFLEFSTTIKPQETTVVRALLGVITMSGGAITDIHSICAQPVTNPCSLAYTS